ncbi:MAG: thermonuclease family protein [Cyclobacteriaceae bacterium]
MKKCLNCLLVLCLITVISCAGQERTDCMVLYVYDGDTMSVLTSSGDTLRVRFDGIDCPEKGMDYSFEAKWYMDSLAYSGPLTLGIMGIDRYGRTLAEVMVHDTISINLSLLERGLAWHYKNFNKDPRYAEAEHYARTNNIGLWADPQPVPPWEYRTWKR